MRIVDWGGVCRGYYCLLRRLPDGTVVCFHSLDETHNSQPPSSWWSLHTSTGSSNSDCLTMCLRSLLLLTLSCILFHINHLQEFQYGSQERKLTVSKTGPSLCSLFYLPLSKNSSFPHEAVSERSFICTCNLAQNHTLSCWLLLCAVYLDSLEDDDKMGVGAQAVLGSCS